MTGVRIYKIVTANGHGNRHGIFGEGFIERDVYGTVESPSASVSYYVSHRYFWQISQVILTHPVRAYTRTFLPGAMTVLILTQSRSRRLILVSDDLAKGIYGNSAVPQSELHRSTFPQ